MKKLFTLSLFSFIICSLSVAQIKLPKLVSNGMVMQRDTPLKIWGYSSPEETITIGFLNKIYKTKANTKGRWNIELQSQKAGGPFTMLLKGKNEIKLKDIYIGDVWLCSGQSNMELPIRRVESRYRKEIKTINNTTIRQFWVPREYNFKEQKEDISNGVWIPATQENIKTFSAVAYFFAKHVQKYQNVPIGLINSSLGGSPVEAWISETDLKPFDHVYHELQKFKDDELIQGIKKDDKKRNYEWHWELAQKDKGRTDSVNWNHPNLNDQNWNSITIPGIWKSEDLKNQNGSIWFRRNFNAPESMVGQSVNLELGRIIDADSVFVNGNFVGNTTYKYPPRKYKIPLGILKTGKNNITIKVISQSGNGGFVTDKKYEITSSLDTILLAGKWKYNIGAKMSPLQAQTFIRWKPAGLYNAMIYPIHNYSIKGVVWYQGESNVGKSKDYEKRLSVMINNWRREWKQGNFPFLIVQLANYLKEKPSPSESEWAKLREAQYKVAATVPNSALACTIDLGEWNDIHPLNKDDVGKRLALAAEKIAYSNKKITASGPSLRKWQIKGNQIEILFNNIGSGLVTKDGNAPEGFSIAGKDGKFVWAQAKIKGSKVIVWNDHILNPIAVRYGWADNPAKANLYNQEQLPTVPFRTDDY